MIRNGLPLKIAIVATNIELILVLCCLFPDVPLGIFLYFIWYENPFLPIMLLPTVVIFVLGLLFDFCREKPRNRKSTRIPLSLTSELGSGLKGLWINGRAFPINRCRVVLSDLSVGAHVSGLLRPKIVMSGGLLFGLTGSDNLSRAIVAHEIGHIRNGDRWMTGVVALALIFAVLQAIDILLPGIFGRDFPGAALGGRMSDIIQDFQGGYSRGGYSRGISYLTLARWISLYTHLAIVSAVLHWREYAADAVGASLVGSLSRYSQLLEAVAAHGNEQHDANTFFHPSIARRKARLAKKRGPLGVNRVLVVFCTSLVVAGGLLTAALISGEEPDSYVIVFIIQSLACVGLLGLSVELVKYVNRIWGRIPRLTS